jgi:hypothetical protein
VADYDPCGPGRTGNDLDGYHVCPAGSGSPDFSFFFRHPGKPHPNSPNAKPDRLPWLSRGFNFGVILLPYVRDWGSPLGVMRRKKALVTILHSFNRHQDRAYALTACEAFIPKTDSFHQPLIEYLITAPPFAGYTWNAGPLRDWCRLAQARADALGAPNSLTHAAAIEAAAAWCLGDSRAVFELYSIETFPWSATDLLEYWRERSEPDLSGAVPVPAGLEPPP